MSRVADIFKRSGTMANAVAVTSGLVPQAYVKEPNHAIKSFEGDISKSRNIQRLLNVAGYHELSSADFEGTHFTIIYPERTMEGSILEIPRVKRKEN